MATVTLKMSEVMAPKRRDWVRGVVDKKNLADLTIIAQDAKHTGYPFLTPIEVVKLAKPTKEGKVYKVIDGTHRYTVLKTLKRKTIEAITLNLTEKEAAIRQWTTNMSHGIRLNRKARNTWVKHMRLDLGMKLSEIAKEVGMTETSVSRMARDKQTKDGPRKQSAPRAAANGNGKAPTAPAAPSVAPKPAPWTPAEFFQRVKLVAAEVSEHPDAIRIYARLHAKEVVKLMEPLSDLVNAALAIDAVKAS